MQEKPNLMNSKERHELRYQRRKAKRFKNKQKFQKSFDEVFSFVNLYRAGKDCCKGSRWKTSTINFETNLLTNIEELYQQVYGDYKYKGFVYFQTVEHGKVRDIHALSIQDRTVQKCYCDNFMIDCYSNGFIKENSASLKGKGYLFALQNFTERLRKHYNKYGTNGCVYQIDFKSYFASLPHDIILQRLREHTQDDRLYVLGKEFVDEFDDLHNSIKGCGVGLGSPVSQTLALDFASPIDHFVKNQTKYKLYGRYMDDSNILLPSTTEAKSFQKEYLQEVNKIGLKINPKKNKITPIKSHGFDFLKVRFSITIKGKIISKLNRRSIKSIKRKIKIFKRWCNEQNFDFEDVCTSYQSWRGSALHMDAYKTVKNIDRMFVNTFRKELAERPNKFKCSLQAKWDEEIGWIYYSSKKELNKILNEYYKAKNQYYENGYVPLYCRWEWREQNKSKQAKIFDAYRAVLYDIA